MSNAIRHGCTVAAIVAVAAAVGGCGSSPKPTVSEPQQVEQVLHSYLHAQTHGDGQAACSLLTESAQHQLQTVVVQAAKGLLPSRPSCQDAVGMVHAVAGAKLMNALASAQITQVRVQGDSATAEITGGTVFGRQQVTLQRSDGTWKIAGVPGLGG
jgi:hypothetical protein